MDMIGFIGMGNMGTAMLKGAKRTFDGSRIIFHRKSVDKMKELAEEEKVNYAMSNSEVVEKSKYIILAIKPQMFEKVIDEINDSLDNDKVIISLAPGFTITQLKEKLKAGRIVRSMPNTPAMIGEGMTGVCFDENEFDENEIDVINKILRQQEKQRRLTKNL